MLINTVFPYPVGATMKTSFCVLERCADNDLSAAVVATGKEKTGALDSSPFFALPA
jgi:hypothetical protein